MSLFKRVKDFFIRLIKRAKTNVKSSPATEEIQTPNEETFEEFKTRNIVSEKLNHLEQYIKIFSLSFPDEYSHYLSIIQTHRKDYETELKNYWEGLNGQITFSIDPECEASRLVVLRKLEDEITNFVELELNFTVYKDKFSKLSSKLNQFYNALFDTKQPTSQITAQLNNAISSMSNLISEVKNLSFFNIDSRKRELILNYVIYGEYIFFKSALRCHLVKNLSDYKSNVSHFHSLFVNSEYDKLIFNFFIEDLELYQNYIIGNLSQEKTFNHILSSCQDLQNKLNNYDTIFSSDDFFEMLLCFENTIDNISEQTYAEYKIKLPQSIACNITNYSGISIKDTAMTILNTIKSSKATILYKVIAKFKVDISWREFYFLCKIFEVYKEVMDASKDTIFNTAAVKFIQYETKYPEYSDDFIKSKKQKLLNYNGQKAQKYVLLLNASAHALPAINFVLTDLKLDYIISGNNVYLNHSYFNGFVNLEQNFGNYKYRKDLL